MPHFVLALFMLFILTSAAPSRADGLIVLTDVTGRYPVGLSLAYLEDPTHQLTINDLTAPAYATQFQPSQEEIPNFGATSSIYWLRFTITNEANPRTNWLLEFEFPTFHGLELYQPTDNGFQVKKVGYVQPFNTRDLPHHNFLFRLDLPPHTPTTFYLRLENAVINVPLTVWSLEAFNYKNQLDYMWLGLYYGILFIMLIYNFMIFLVLRDSSYLYYVLFITNHIFYHLCFMGLAPQYLWPNLTWPNYFTIPLTLALSITTLVLFTVSFLQIKQQNPRLYIWIRYLIGLWLIFVLVSPLGGRMYIVFLLPFSLFTFVFLLILATISWRKGYQPARYYLMAWSLFLIACIMSILFRIKLLNLPHIANPETSIVYLGSIIVVTLLSFALADRINLLQRTIQKAHQHLTQSEHKFRSLFENSKDAIVITTLKGQIVESNLTAQQLFGYTPNDKGADIDLLSHYVNLTDRQNLQTSLTEKGYLKDYELKFRRRDGSIFDASVTATLQKSDEVYIHSIIRDITSRKQAEQERLKFTAMQRELKLAGDIQSNFLPPPRPLWPDIQVICFTTPTKEVGGDFYAYQRLREGYSLAVGDISGKGVPAAMLMGVSMAALQAINPQELPPPDLLSQLDQTLVSYTKHQRQNCAMCYAELKLISPETYRLRVANAGCVMPIIKRNNNVVEWVEVGGMPLGTGFSRIIPYAYCELTLTRGDMLILTTDGVVEANNAANEMFGFPRLESTLQAAPAMSAEAMLDYLKQTLMDFVGQAEQHDDITIVVAQV